MREWTRKGEAGGQQDDSFESHLVIIYVLYV
jgi:hypothetical protein